MATHGNISQIQTGVPEPTLRRMPLYVFYLKRLRESGVMHVSAPSIGKHFNFDPTQVVKDLNYSGVSGRPRIGYNIYELISGLENFLGYNRKNEAFLVGVGNLGSALLSYQGLMSTGVSIVAGFDIDQSKIGSRFGESHVLHIDKFKDLAQRLHISIGILTTPTSAAQKTAELMVSSGIKAIWNLTPVILKLKSDIIVQNTSMYSNLTMIVKKLNDKELAEKEENNQN